MPDTQHSTASLRDAVLTKGIRSKLQVPAVLEQNKPRLRRLWLLDEDFVLANQSTFKPFERYSDRLLGGGERTPPQSGRFSGPRLLRFSRQGELLDRDLHPID